MHCWAMQSSPLAEGGKTLVEYVWIGAGSQLCSKTKVLDDQPRGIEDVPVISVDGAACGLTSEGGEVFLKPRKLFNDPFRGGGHLLALCDIFQVEQPAAPVSFTSPVVPVLQPHPTNNRVPCEDMMARCRSSEPTFTAEQEFAVLPGHAATPMVSQGSDSACMRLASDASACTLPFPFAAGTPPQREQYLPVAGSPPGGFLPHHAVHAVTGRTVAEKHMQCCLRAGIKVTEVAQRSAPPYPAAPGSHPVWSYQVGPLPGVELADQLWMSRFLLLRVSEGEGSPVSFDPAHHSGLPRGLRCSFGFSTAGSRHCGAGLGILQQHVELLRAAHIQHTLAYSMAGGPTNLSACQFSVGVGSGNGSIVIPSLTLLQQAGQFVDCRPGSNVDPYVVATMLASTTHKLPLQMVPHRHILQQSVKHAFSHPSVGAASQMSHPSVCYDDCCDDDFDEDDIASLNSEDVLIDELDRMDGLSPDTPPRHFYGLACTLLEEGYDECTSPELPLELSCY